MQELRDVDHVDAPENKRSTWYSGQQPPVNQNYNPENDVDVLQSQYQPLIDLQEEERNLQRAIILRQSEM